MSIPMHTLYTMSMRQIVAGSACGGTPPFSRVRQNVAGSACGGARSRCRG